MTIITRMKCCTIFLWVSKNTKPNQPSFPSLFHILSSLLCCFSLLCKHKHFLIKNLFLTNNQVDFLSFFLRLSMTQNNRKANKQSEAKSCVRTAWDTKENCFIIAMAWNPKLFADETFDYDFAGATTTNLPPGVLYRVKATYKYIQEDGDELSFDVGDIINVIEYDDPEDQVKVDVANFEKFLIISFTNLLGGRLADGHKRRRHRKRNVPSELHPAVVNFTLLCFIQNQNHIFYKLFVFNKKFNIVDWKFFR